MSSIRLPIIKCYGFFRQNIDVANLVFPRAVQAMVARRRQFWELRCQSTNKGHEYCRCFGHGYWWKRDNRLARLWLMMQVQVTFTSLPGPSVRAVPDSFCRASFAQRQRKCKFFIYQSLAGTARWGEFQSSSDITGWSIISSFDELRAQKHYRRFGRHRFAPEANWKTRKKKKSKIGQPPMALNQLKGKQVL